LLEEVLKISKPPLTFAGGKIPVRTFRNTRKATAMATTTPKDRFFVESRSGPCRLLAASLQLLRFDLWLLRLFCSFCCWFAVLFAAFAVWFAAFAVQHLDFNYFIIDFCSISLYLTGILGTNFLYIECIYYFIYYYYLKQKLFFSEHFYFYFNNYFETCQLFSHWYIFVLFYNYTFIIIIIIMKHIFSKYKTLYISQWNWWCSHMMDYHPFPKCNYIVTFLYRVTWWILNHPILFPSRISSVKKRVFTLMDVLN